MNNEKFHQIRTEAQQICTNEKTNSYDSAYSNATNILLGCHLFTINYPLLMRIKENF